MGRRANKERMEQIGRYVEDHPGSRPYHIAQGLGLAPSSVTRTLPALEEEGILLSEDDRGRLWPFRKRQG